MKEISLTQGKVALVDEELFDSLNQRECILNENHPTDEQAMQWPINYRGLDIITRLN